MPTDLSKLNEEQKEAVLCEKGPLLIVAGAGTGKTTVITRRIVNLIEKGFAKPEEILAVTFTEKAAYEMEERVDKLLDFGYVDLWISTFHAFCEKVLRENALDIGLSPDFKILDSTAGWLLARKNLDKFDLKYYQALGNPTKFIQALISHFSHCKDQEIYPEDYLNYADALKTTDNGKEDEETERITEIANIYHTYQQILLDNGALDFGDLINFCLKLFKKRPQILKKYQNKFKYILVDEFQDTNWSQYELIKMLAEPNNNLTVCADDDQAIYRWRGASFSNIIKFKEDFPNAKQVSLINNYRSAQNILDKSYNFIKQNDPDRLEFRIQINKKLIANTKEQGIIEHIHAKNLDQEVGETLKKILEILKRDKDANYNDFAILVRANDTAIPYIKALERAGLPYQFLASRGLYSKPIILDIISYFKLLDNYHESSAFYRILNLPFLEISETDIATITQYSHKKTKSLYESMQELTLIPGISGHTQEKIALILSLIQKHTEQAKNKGVSELLLAFLEDSGYLKYIIDNNQTEKLDLVNQFYKKVKAFEESALDPILKNFMEQINLEFEAGEEGKLEFDPEKGPDMIKVMTIHAAKGLEFKYVFLVGMVDRRFPTDQRKDPIELPDEMVKDIKPTGDVHLQEERRLCYVAMTRAKKELYFTSAVDYGGQRAKKLSRFLVEMGYKAEETKTSDAKTGVLAEKIKPTDRLKQKTGTEYIPDHFSFSQLAAFEKCPLQYKFNFILKVPVRGKAAFSFGHTMHNTLYDFFKFVSEPGQKNKLLERLMAFYEKNWVDEWYDSKKNKEEYLEKGKKILKAFYKEYQKNPPKILDTKEGLALELPFNLKIGQNTIIGKIDRIDDLGNGQVQIMDYKTGTSKDKPEKDQLLIYQLAAKEVLGLNPKLLSFYYLDDGKVFSFLGSEMELENQKQQITDQIEKIKKSEFTPTPGWQCQYCDFKDICDWAEK
jgi:DNA helicase-2/ATP-dependent DNA helicase PcrA